jgi:hypothetical protein
MRARRRGGLGWAVALLAAGLLAVLAGTGRADGCGSGWLCHRNCPPPSYDRLNYWAPAVAYVGYRYHHPVHSPTLPNLDPTLPLPPGTALRFPCPGVLPQNYPYPGLVPPR